MSHIDVEPMQWFDSASLYLLRADGVIRLATTIATPPTPTAPYAAYFCMRPGSAGAGAGSTGFSIGFSIGFTTTFFGGRSIVTCPVSPCSTGTTLVLVLPSPTFHS